MVSHPEFMTVLTHSVRVLSLSQMARLWWSDTRWGRQRARQHAMSCESQGLLHFKRVLSRPIGVLKTPLLIWRLDDDEPDWVAVSRGLRLRTRKHPVLLPVVFASRLAFDVFATSRVTPFKLTQMTHDLHVSEVFVCYQLLGLPLDSWVSEDRLPITFPSDVRPDALLVDSEGTWQRAVEYGGAYSSARLLALRDCAAKCEVAFELW